MPAYAKLNVLRRKSDQRCGWPGACANTRFGLQPGLDALKHFTHPGLVNSALNAGVSFRDLLSVFLSVGSSLSEHRKPRRSGVILRASALSLRDFGPKCFFFDPECFTNRL